MKWYIAAFDRIQAQRIRTILLASGHEVVSTWLDESSYGKPKTTESKSDIAARDCAECGAADAIVMIEDGNGKGGRYVELGLVMGRGGECHIIGERGCIFGYTPGLGLHATIEVFADWIKEHPPVVNSKTAVQLHPPFVVGLVGAPSTGKTTFAREIAVQLSASGYVIEMVSEYAREYIQRFGRIKEPWEQLLIFDKQMQKETDVRNSSHAQLVICECPTFVGLAYAQTLIRANGAKDRMSMSLLERWITDSPCVYDRIYWLNPTSRPFVADGIRDSHRDQQKQIASVLRGMMDFRGISYTTLEGSPDEWLMTVISDFSQHLRATGQQQDETWQKQKQKHRAI